MPKNNDLIAIAKATNDYIETIRNYLHEHPEPRWKEDATLAYLQDNIARFARIEGCKMRIDTKYSGGLVVDLDFAANYSNTRMLFRADVDALPVTEEETHSPCSKNPGYMHACGHDIHSAILLAVFKLCVEGTVKPAHNLRFVWQRAEENPGMEPIPESGGERLVREGVLEGIEEVYALHVWSTENSNVFYSCPGPIFANSARLKIDIQCKGGHASQPESGVNAIDIVVALYNTLANLKWLQQDQIKLAPTIVQAGTASNVLPNRAEIWYSFRNFYSEEKRQEVLSELRKELELLAKQFAASIQLQLIPGHPTTINTPESVNFMAYKLIKHEQFTKNIPPKYAGEDFSHYLNNKPGSLWLLGCGNADAVDHHSPGFNPQLDYWRGLLFFLIRATSKRLVVSKGLFNATMSEDEQQEECNTTFTL